MNTVTKKTRVGANGWLQVERRQVENREVVCP